LALARGERRLCLVDNRLGGANVGYGLERRSAAL
jgi:hypothetical protein